MQALPSRQRHFFVGNYAIKRAQQGVKMAGVSEGREGDRRRVLTALLLPPHP